jgi:hypothetical protein
MRQAKLLLDFRTAEGEFYPQGSVGRVCKMKWEDIGGCFSVGVKVFTVVQPRKTPRSEAPSQPGGRSRALVASGSRIAESGNGRTPGGPRGAR